MVVFITAFTGRETLDGAKEAEPFGYSVKPFDEQDLRTVIEMALFNHRADVRIRASEARYRALTDSAYDAIVSADSAGLIVGWNRGSTRIFGYTEGGNPRPAHGRVDAGTVPGGLGRRHGAGVVGRRTPRHGSVHRAGRPAEGRQRIPRDLSLTQWETPEGKFSRASYAIAPSPSGPRKRCGGKAPPLRRPLARWSSRMRRARSSG